MHAADITTMTALEDHHWWFKERRRILARWLERLAAAGQRPGRAMDIGAAGGGNTRVLRARGWQSVALEYSEAGARVARDRGLAVLRADATALPIATGGLDLVTAFDVVEHIPDDHAAMAEIHRALRPGASLLVTVPADMRLWSEHDVAAQHCRRYERPELKALVEGAGFVIDELWSWNVLLRPVVALRRRRSTGNDLTELPAVVNAGLTAAIVAERYLPVKSLPGVSLMLRAHRR